MTMSELDYVRSTVRQVPDFPKPGILFSRVKTAPESVSFSLNVTFSGVGISLNSDEQTAKKQIAHKIESIIFNLFQLHF